MNGLVPSLALVGAIVLASSAMGYMATPAFLPAGPGRRAERLGWAFLIGALLIAGMVPLSFLAGMRPGWIPLFVLGGFVLFCARRFALKMPAARSRSVETCREQLGGAVVALVLIALGVAVYAVVSLAEPMSSTDYLAVWGLKAKTIYGSGEVPDRLFRAFTLRLSHPEYPLGLPMLYAGTAFLLGRWDDHALALLFPLVQIATLLALYGWLRRRGASRALALEAITPLSLYYPLYADRVGTAEVPLSLGILLFGTSLADSLDRTDAGALVRLALGSFFVASIKNEGWFITLAAVLVVAASGLARPRRPSFSVLAAALLPAAAVRLLHILLHGPIPLQDFDFGYLLPSRLPEFASRLWKTVLVAAEESVLPAWPALLALLLVWACGRKTPSADVLFTVLALCVASYVFLPALTPDPLLQIRNSFERTVAPLAPLLAAALALRLAPVSVHGPLPGERPNEAGPPRARTRTS
jgi:hypothetical protein